jgi:energy-converting hydrogenase Eha subunit G
MKLPFSFGTRLVFRLVLPGLVATLALLPILRYWQLRVVPDVALTLILPFIVVFLGWLINLVDMPIYQIFEGRRF